MRPDTSALPISHRDGRPRRGPTFRLALGLLLSGSLAPAAAAVSGELFERYEVVTGSAPHQTVLPGFFLGGRVADLAVVHIRENDDRRLRVYSFDGDGWEPRLDARLGSEVLFVDVAEIGGRDRLITYRPGLFSWFDPESATERDLLEIAASFRATGGREIAHVDVTRDLNQDGRDDIVVPDLDGFWVSTQSVDGSFTRAVKLGPPEPYAGQPVGYLDVGEAAAKGPRTYGEVGITAATIPIYLGRVHTLDYDQDGRSDLVFWSEDRFEVYLQEERGRFDPVARTFTTEVPFDSEGAYSRAFDYAGKGAFSAVFGLGAKTERTMLHSLRDLDGDGVADLMTLTLSGRSLTRQRSVYEMHRGSATGDGTVFAREASAALRPRGKAGGMQPWGYSSHLFEDLDGDDRVDVLFSDVAVGIGGMLRALVGNSVPINLAIYRGEDGTYPERPTTRRRVRRFAPFAGLGNIHFPPVLTGDVDGDGLSDLVVGQSPQELHVYLGVPGPELLAKDPLTVAVTLPPDERKTRLVDLDRDGKQDVLIQRTPTERAPHEPHRLTMLISRWEDSP